MKIGDKVLYEGQVSTVTRVARPRCRCKGMGFYEIQIDDTDRILKIPGDVVLESYKPPTMANQQLEVHKF